MHFYFYFFVQIVHGVRSARVHHNKSRHCLPEYITPANPNDVNLLKILQFQIKPVLLLTDAWLSISSLCIRSTTAQRVLRRKSVRNLYPRSVRLPLALDMLNIMNGQSCWFLETLVSTFFRSSIPILKWLLNISVPFSGVFTGGGKEAPYRKRRFNKKIKIYYFFFMTFIKLFRNKLLIVAHR